MIVICNECFEQWWVTQINANIYQATTSSPCPGKAPYKCLVVFTDTTIE